MKWLCRTFAVVCGPRENVRVFSKQHRLRFEHGGVILGDAPRRQADSLVYF